MEELTSSLHFVLTCRTAHIPLDTARADGRAVHQLSVAPLCNPGLKEFPNPAYLKYLHTSECPGVSRNGMAGFQV